MAVITTQPYIKFMGDHFVIVHTVENAGALPGFKAEVLISEKVVNEETGAVTFTVKVKKNTPGHFTPDIGGIEIIDNQVLTTIDGADYASLDAETYDVQLTLWDDENKDAVASYAYFDFREVAPSSTLV